MKRCARLALLCALPACSQTSSGGSDMAPPPPCGALTMASRFPSGSNDGHADPFGARAAKQARAGRVRDPAMIFEASDARAHVRVGDYVLANSKIAAYIEGQGESDGYASFAGEIVALETVGDDGRPRRLSQYGETLLTLSKQGVKPDSVSVLNDGSDGKPAVVRVSGKLTNLPFLSETLSIFFPQEYDLPVALDYVLAPDSDKLLLHLSLINPAKQPVDLSTVENFGFFQSSRSRLFTPAAGYAEPQGGDTPWVAFDGGRSAFGWRSRTSPLKFFINVSGFQYFGARDLMLDGCAEKTLDYAEITVGGSIDEVLAALRRDDGVASREQAGRVLLGDGAPAVGAVVHALAADGKLLTRAIADAAGRFTLHLPAGAARLVPTLRGLDTPPPAAAPPGGEALLAFPKGGTIIVRALDAASKRPLPARVQVVPTRRTSAPPAEWGVAGERNERLHQEYTTTGEARLSVPAGEHTVIVSHGFEWELLQQKVMVDAGRTVTLDASLLHSVDSSGVMCADFHIHSLYSADSADPVEYKVRGALADGLEIPVSSEHEWIIDFQPIIKQLGMTRWAFGLPSEEFTTFTWGHFGIIPINPRPEAVNNGAVAWVGKKPPEVFQTIAELPEKPLLIVNHPSGGGFGAYVSASNFNRATAAGDAEMWSDRFGAVEVFNDSDLESNRSKSVADWFALLNAGKIVWAVGSSDSHSLASSPVGYPRTCIRFGHDDPEKLTAEAVRDGVKRGAAVVSGGLYMTVSGPGGAGPGAMMMNEKSPTFRVVVQAPQWLFASTLEVIVDGETVQTVQLQEQVGGAARSYPAQIQVTAKSPRPLHWVVFHASAKADLAPLAPGRRPFAVSNPIFF